jgi:hypothetical protein
MQSGVQGPEQRVIVASADTHVGPLLGQLREYCERRHLDDFDSFAGATQVAPGRVAASLLPSPGEADYSLIVTPGHCNIEERLRQLDQDGVATEVIFHGSQNGQPLSFSSSAFSFSSLPSGQEGRVLELSLAGAQIYNRWLADFCSVEPRRHAGMVQLRVWDQAVADRIGPSAEELGTAVRTEEIPSVAGRTEFSMAFQRGDIWV